ncbi:MAG: hypothetical protein OHK0046_19850 [Anaerolineae bacterium]
MAAFLGQAAFMAQMNNTIIPDAPARVLQGRFRAWPFPPASREEHGAAFMSLL